MILKTLLIISLLGCIGDSLSTYIFLKKGFSEGNVLAKKVFDFLGINLGSIILFLITVFYSFYVYLNENITDTHKIILLTIFSILKIAATLHNTTNKKIWVVEILRFLVPIYWDWNKIINFFKRGS